MTSQYVNSIVRSCIKMSILAIPYGETLDSSIEKTRTLASYKLRGRNWSPLREQWTIDRHQENNDTKIFTPSSCDPLLDFINLDDFENDEKLQRNFDDIFKIHKMGFPVKIIKQNWFPGLICIPIFHCQRCLALWTQTAQVPSLCSEMNRSVYGRLVPISVTKCDLLTKLLDRKPTARRLCKQVSVSKPEEREVKPERFTGNNFGGKICRPLPVAEFVDINEQLQKYRKKFRREFKGIGTEASGRFLETGARGGPASSPVGDYGSQEELTCGIKGRMETVDSNYGTALSSEKTSAVDEDGKFKFNPSYYNQRIHDRSCNVNVKCSKDSHRAKLSTSEQGKRLENGLTITSKNKATKLTTVGTKPTKLTPRQITKMKRPATKTCRQSTNPEVSSDVAYENKLAELRQKTLAFDKRALKVAFGDKLETVLGDKLETLDASMVNSLWFKSLVEDLGKKEEKLRTYKPELTRAFCFSYFELLRNVDKVH